MDSKQKERAVFVLSSMRSGSTLLRYLLAGHSRLACPPETKFLMALEDTLRFPQMLRALTSIGLTKKELYRYYRTFAENIFQGYAQREGKPRWIDKTPGYYRCVTFIDEVFEQEPQYLCLIRNPLDCIHSLEAFADRFPWSVAEDPDAVRITSLYGSGRLAWARYWKEVYEVIDCFKRCHPSRCYLIKYEELVKDPNTTMKRIIEFLGERPEGLDIANALRAVKAKGYQDDKILKAELVHTHSVGCSLTWTVSEQEPLWEVVSLTAAKFGYDRHRQQSLD